MVVHRTLLELATSRVGGSHRRRPAPPSRPTGRPHARLSRAQERLADKPRPTSGVKDAAVRRQVGERDEPCQRHRIALDGGALEPLGLVVECLRQRAIMSTSILLGRFYSLLIPCAWTSKRVCRRPSSKARAVDRRSSSRQLNGLRSTRIRSASLPARSCPSRVPRDEGGVVNRIKTQRFETSELSIGVQHATFPDSKARLRRPDAEPGVPGIRGLDRVEADHVVGAAADRQAHSSQLR